MNSSLFRRLAAILAVAFSLDSAAQAAQTAVRAQLDCPSPNIRDRLGKSTNRAPSCGIDRGLEDVQREYSKLLRARQNCSMRGNAWACGGSLHAFTIAYPPCDAGRSLGEPDFMAPVSVLPGGPSRLRTLLESASTGRPFGGRYQIVEGVTSDPNERHLALCDVRVVAGSTTQPRDCETVAIITPKVTWLRGQVGLQHINFGSRQFLCPVSGHLRQTGAIDISFKIQAQPDILSLAGAVKTMLDQELKLSPTMNVERYSNGNIYHVNIISAAPLRNSLILSNGWREAIDFDVDLFMEREGVNEPNAVKVSGTAHVMVSRTAAGSLTEYQGTNDAQRSQYLEALNSRVLSAIRGACKTASVVDDTTVLCQPPAKGIAQ